MQVREQGQQKGEASPFLAELQRLEEQAKQQGLGRWNKVVVCTIWLHKRLIIDKIFFFSCIFFFMHAGSSFSGAKEFNLYAGVCLCTTSSNSNT